MPSWGSAVPGKSFVHSHACPAPTSMGPNQVKRTGLELEVFPLEADSTFAQAWKIWECGAQGEV